MQIKTSEIPKYRKMFAAKQKYKCALCGTSIAAGMVALDHCHTTGHLRGVLCGTCNRNEGKLKKAAQYMAKITHLSKTNYIGFLQRLIDYLKYYEDNPSGIVHPTYDLEKGKQKPVKRKRRTKK